MAKKATTWEWQVNEVTGARRFSRVFGSPKKKGAVTIERAEPATKTEGLADVTTASVSVPTTPKPKAKDG